jgi:hypothetical protein
MSDVEDDFMCEEEEDYGLVRDINHWVKISFLLRQMGFTVIFNSFMITGIFGRQQLRTRCRSREPILQLQSFEGR